MSPLHFQNYFKQYQLTDDRQHARLRIKFPALEFVVDRLRNGKGSLV